MASRGTPHGLSAQVANKIAAKRDSVLEAECLAWIEAVLGGKLPAGTFENVLRDGQILCRLVWLNNLNNCIHQQQKIRLIFLSACVVMMSQRN